MDKSPQKKKRWSRKGQREKNAKLIKLTNLFKNKVTDASGKMNCTGTKRRGGGRSLDTG